jgi:hypothetical protein
MGHRIKKSSIPRLLGVLRYRRQVNRKTLAGSSHPDRYAQFEHINAAVGERESGTVRLKEAVAACRTALEEAARVRVPLDRPCKLHREQLAQDRAADYVGAACFLENPTSITTSRVIFANSRRPRDAHRGNAAASQRPERTSGPAPERLCIPSVRSSPGL